MNEQPQYVVFWLPTIFHDTLQSKKTEITNCANKEGFFDLSDGSDYPYLAKFKLLEKGDIVVFSKVTTLNGVVEFDTTLTLEYKQKRRNGFMQFSFKETDVPENCRVPFKLNLTNPIYHKIKEFYHEHECNTGKDSDLVPKITKDSIDLEKDDNSALVRFLVRFSDLFCETAKFISSLNAKANEVFREYDAISQDSISELDRDSLKELQSKMIEKINKINALCENVSIEYTYCRTLLASIHNKSFKHDVTLNTDDEDFEKKNLYRRKALNIRNSLRYIENIKFKNLNRQHKLLRISNEEIKNITTKVDETLKKSDKWQRISLVLAVYSILSGFRTEIHNYCDSLFGIISVICIAFLFVNIPKHISWLLKKIQYKS